MQKAIIQLETLVCPSCSMKIEGALKSLEGIEKESISVSFNTSKVRFNFDPEKLSIEKIESAIISQGYEIIKSQVKAK